MHADVPVFTYNSWELQIDTGGGVYATSAISSVTLDSASLKVSVYETNSALSATHSMKVRCFVDQKPGYVVEDTFVVSIYDLIPSVTQPMYYIVGSNPMFVTVPAFTLTNAGGLTAAQQVVTYSLVL